MSSYTIELDDYFGAAMEKLKGTRGRTRRSSEEGSSAPKRSKPRRKPEKTISEEDTDDEESIQDKPQPPPHGSSPSAPPGDSEDRPDASIIYSMLLEVRENQTKMMAMMTSTTESLDKDRQITNNLSLRVETLQKARMLGLTAQPHPSRRIRSLQWSNPPLNRGEKRTRVHMTNHQ
ncbi:unnamed protein product [Parnassius apollo]|uniref:(apollo) hypothetical protein n=1 Tax=Parnassius apollo TaxID=110799 RepID=A0A8S3W0M6_PARAO|nr:unnamed protein product [Parnassius apollo]